jgi:hypothetical protein
MHDAIPPNVPASLAPLLRRDGEWLRCAEPNCGDRAFWGIFRNADFLRVKVQAHRAKVHAGRAARPQAGRPQRRAAAAGAQGAAPLGLDVNVLAQLAEAAAALATQHEPKLGQGIARKVVALGPNLVCKIGMPHGMMGDGRKHNLAEARDYAAAPAHVKPWLCPVVACSPEGTWLIARRASDVGMVSDADRKRLRSALAGVVDDLHGANIGLLDGKPVAIDYGFGLNQPVRRVR